MKFIMRWFWRGLLTLVELKFDSDDRGASVYAMPLKERR